MIAPTRRALLAAGLAVFAAPARAVSGPRGWRVPYGVAVNTQLLTAEPAYATAIATRCASIVPEGGLKWAVIRPTRERFDFAEGDACLAFAAAHGLAMRGHNLVWADAMPDWTKTIAADEAEAVLVEHIRRVAGHYKGRLTSWDVVNEPMAPEPARTGDLRPSIWLKHLGPSHIDLAFRTAAAADPAAKLVLNEFGIEYADAASARKRAGLLDLLRGLRARGVPVHAVGLQGHLQGERAVDGPGLETFVRAVRALDLEVLVTELDVIDNQLPAPPAERDAAVAAVARSFLAPIFAVAPPAALLTWGITDRYTWVPTWFRRRDGLPNRPLPLDADYRPKPLMDVIETFCR